MTTLIESTSMKINPESWSLSRSFMPFSCETVREPSAPAKHLFSDSCLCLLWPGILSEVKSGKQKIVWEEIHFIILIGQTFPTSLHPMSDTPNKSSFSLYTPHFRGKPTNTRRTLIRVFVPLLIFAGGRELEGLQFFPAPSVTGVLCWCRW